MQERLIELSVGETLHVGQYTVTVVAVEGEELCFEIDNGGQNESDEFTLNEELALSLS